eukprot:TRINITY_DN78155_c0_g1_i1.p1 TRINITY_DN78155_c0_g1~~TRINITY_DN78155_c0_g1_i1.p1  ORF type:complete len:144 (+),score=15.35 TRINITY_DN78155_c0_g1_i1:52-432(+)
MVNIERCWAGECHTVRVPKGPLLKLAKRELGAEQSKRAIEGAIGRIQKALQESRSQVLAAIVARSLEKQWWYVHRCVGGCGPVVASDLPCARGGGEKTFRQRALRASALLEHWLVPQCGKGAGSGG